MDPILPDPFVDPLLGVTEYLALSDRRRKKTKKYKYSRYGFDDEELAGFVPFSPFGFSNLRNANTVRYHLQRFQRLLQGPSPLPPLLADQLNLIWDMERKMADSLEELDKQLGLMTEDPGQLADDVLKHVANADDEWYLHCNINCRFISCIHATGSLPWV